MICYQLPEDLATVKIMCEVMPAGTVVTFAPPPVDSLPVPPKDFAEVPEEWERG